MTSSFCLFRRLAVAACLATTLARPASAEDPAVLRVVSPWEWTTNEPSDTGFLMTRLQIAETLVMVEPDGRLVGGVAESWAVDPDTLTWRFRIRPNMQFHDGTPVRAAAVESVLRRALASPPLRQIPLETLRVEGETLVIKTLTPFSPLPAALSDYAAVILAPQSWDASGHVTRIIGTGPYRLVRQEGKTGQELERFDGYYGARPAIARVRHTAVVNGDARTNMAVAGDADLLFTTVPSATSRIDAGGAMQVTSLTIARARMVTFNASLPQFADKRVRRAISMALDRKGMAASVLRHPASSASQLLPPMLRQWHDPALEAGAYAHDPVRARALLEEAGWRMGADGVRSKDGHRLSATLMTIANRPELTVMATAMQAQLKAIGMELQVEPGPSAAIVAAVNDGRLQMSMYARAFASVADPIAVIIPDYTAKGAPWGAVNWDGSVRMKTLTDAYVASFDDSQRQALSRQMTALLHEDMPVMAVSWFEHTVAVNRRLSGVVIDPYETRYHLNTITLRTP